MLGTRIREPLNISNILLNINDDKPPNGVVTGGSLTTHVASHATTLQYDDNKVLGGED
jgi:hypothetical protein